MFDKNGCGTNGLLSGVFDLLIDEHESNGENLKRASLDFIVSKDTNSQKV